MRDALKMFGLTLLFVGLIDGVAAVALGWADRSGRLGSLVQFFEYGRSVPGKHARWDERPNVRGNLYDVGWRSNTVAISAEQLAASPAEDGPFIRSYGMSFTANVRRQSLSLRPDLNWDAHAGPAGPPNYTYALFQDDRSNRREGDIAVLGLLSAVVPTMAAMSNQTRVFEQPAPLTYPIYQPDGADGLVRIDPQVTTPAQQRALSSDSAARAAWHSQLATHDAYFSPITFGWPGLDVSPFARLVRRSLAQSHIDKTIADIATGDSYPYDVVLQRMVRDFAETARSDGQTPVVMLMQTNRRPEIDLLAMLQPVLDAHDITYFATADIIDLTDPTAYQADGHFTTEVDRVFAQHFIEMLNL